MVETFFTISMKKIKLRFLFLLSTIIVISLLLIKKENMTLRQSVLNKVYGLIMWQHKVWGNKKFILSNTNHIQPNTAVYNLFVTLNSGETVKLEQHKGKKILLVNTASDCGYTAQYADLEKLYQQYKNELVIYAFPANDFKAQEKGSDNEIATFCKVNYGISFPIVKKSVVVKGPQQHPVFKWLSDESENGWCNQAPNWNFTKYLIDENGVLMYRFGKEISPLDEEFIKALKNL